MDSLSGKIMATAAGLATASFLLSQMTPEEEPVIENYINYRLGGRIETFFKDPKTGSAVAVRPGSRIDRLLAGCDDDTFFQPRNLQSTAGSRTDSGKTVTGGPPETVGARINMQLASPQQRKTELKDFAAAAQAGNVYRGATGQAAAGAPVIEGQAGRDGEIEHYHAAEGDPRRPAANAGKRNVVIARGGASFAEIDRARSSPLAGSDLRSHTLPTAQTSPVGCGPQGTIREYSGQRLMAANFEYPPGKSAILQPAVSLTDTLPVGNMSIPGPDGAPMDIQIADRLIYSTLTRARCPGTVDMIRGDLPIPKGGQYSAPAGNPADTLEAGAFAAMFGLDARSAQQTTALILADQAGTRPTLGGADIAELTLEAARMGIPSNVLGVGSTAPGAATLAAKSILASADGSHGARTGADTKNGGVTVFAGLA